MIKSGVLLLFSEASRCINSCRIRQSRILNSFLSKERLLYVQIPRAVYIRYDQGQQGWAEATKI